MKTSAVRNRWRMADYLPPARIVASESMRAASLDRSSPARRASSTIGGISVRTTFLLNRIVSPITAGKRLPLRFLSS